METTLCLSGLVIPDSSFGPGYESGESATTACEAFIGVVVFRTHRGEYAEAILDVDGVWRCRKLPVLDRVLNTLHAPKRGSGDDVPFGLAELVRVAAWFKGVARVQRT